MEFEFRQIELSSIDASDSTYRISTDRSVEQLKLSIQQMGMINPPILLSHADRFIIVSGFARLNAVAGLGWKAVGARCLPADTPFTQCAGLAIADNWVRGPLNLVELANIVVLAKNAERDGEDMGPILSACGLSGNRELWSKLVSVSEMNERLRQGLAQGILALPTAIVLQEMVDRDGADDLTDLLLELPLSLNRQREVIDWVEATARREETTVTQILSEGTLQKLRRDAALDTPRKANLIRNYLRRRRYPEISGTEEQFAQIVKALNLPKGVRLTPPAYFEGQIYSLNVEFKKLDDLAHTLKALPHLIDCIALQRFIGEIDPSA